MTKRQGAQVQQRGGGTLQRQLPPHEQPHEHGAGHGGCLRGHRGLGGVLGTESAQAVDQGAEARCRQGDGHPVDGSGLRLTDVDQVAPPEYGHGAGDGKHGQEQQPPRPQLQQHTGDGGAQGGSDGDDEGYVAHDAAAVVRRYEGHQRGHEQRHHDGRAAGLDDAGGQQYGEGRRCRGQSRAGKEQGHRETEGGAGRHALEEPPRHRDDDGHGEHESRGQPARGRCGDVEIAHEPRNRVHHDRLVEEDDERGQHENPQHGGDAGGREGGRCSWCGHGAFRHVSVLRTWRATLRDCDAGKNSSVSPDPVGPAARAQTISTTRHGRDGAPRRHLSMTCLPAWWVHRPVSGGPVR